MELKIDEKCTGCGACVTDCPVGVLALVDGCPSVRAEKASCCLNCRHCQAVCPVGALALNGVSAADCIPEEELPLPSAEQMRGLMMARASSFSEEVLRRRKATHDMDKFTEKTLGCERKYTGKIISVDLLDIELPDGRKAKREVIRHGNAVAILARRPDGKFVFVKQYRKAAEEALVEVIAGGLEKGEDPEEGARRETAEETGYDVKSLRFLMTIICTPGYCEERIHIYFAELADEQHAQDQDPDENVFPVVLSENEVHDGIRNGTIFDAKTLSAWACYKLM